jgi:uncharacterized iron-regulated membrane protein
LSFIDRPQSVFARRALFQVHLWVGVTTGLYIFVVCATGAALVFRIDMQRARHPHLFTPSAAGPPADPVAIMNSVTRAYPGERLAGVDAPTTARPTYLAYTWISPITVSRAPQSSAHNGREPLPWRRLVDEVMAWVVPLHVGNFGGLGLRIAWLVLGLAPPLLFVTGFIMWWTRVVRDAPARRRSLERVGHVGLRDR